MTSRGHIWTHIGSPPQWSHLNILLVTGSIEQPPKGQATTQSAQPMHLSSLTETSPVTLSLDIAFTGQTLAHTGTSHCWHVIGMSRPFSSHLITCIRDLAGVTCPSCTKEHHVSHILQPVHFSGSITMVLCMVLTKSDGFYSELSKIQWSQLDEIRN
jgi:hypothetical protein